MNAKPLFTQDKSDIVAYFCSECRIVKATEKEAEKCCKPLFCATCGGLVEQYRNVCETCAKKISLSSLKTSLAKAIRLKKPTTDKIYSEGLGSDDGYIDFSELDEVVAEDECEMPLFVYDCQKEVWAGLDAESILENSLEGDWYEDAIHNVELRDELENMIKLWNDKQTLNQYMVNMEKIIVINDAQFDAWLADDHWLAE